jgi:hypothetical protein
MISACESAKAVGRASLRIAGPGNIKRNLKPLVKMALYCVRCTNSGDFVAFRKAPTEKFNATTAESRSVWQGGSPLSPRAVPSPFNSLAMVRRRRCPWSKELANRAPPGQIRTVRQRCPASNNTGVSDLFAAAGDRIRTTDVVWPSL